MFKNIESGYFIFFCIVVGIFLRLNWIGDMEWKADEQWMYEKAHEIAGTGKFPAAGMQSGGGIVNPGMSVFVFSLIAKFTDDPLAMNRVVQIINIVAIICFVLFALNKLKADEQHVWLYGIALASVSPLAVLFARKIWAQDLLPLFSFLVILGNFYRQKKLGAFLWGLTGALIGQIHMSGFFYAAGIFVFTLLHDRYNKLKFSWPYWLAGTILGSITIVPWIIFMLNNPQESRLRILHIFLFNFYIFWFLDAHGLNIMYSMRKEFWQFIREPVVGGIPVYLIALTHLFLAAVGIFSVERILRFARNIFNALEMKSAPVVFLKNISVTKFYLSSILLGLGVFMPLSGITVHPHYLICAFPFSYVFLARILSGKKWLLKGIIVAQLFITVMFQVYVHQHNGIKDGDYGITYKSQIENTGTRPPRGADKTAN